LSIRSISPRQKSFKLGVGLGTSEFVRDFTPQRNASRRRRWGKRFFVVVDEPFFTALREGEAPQQSEVLVEITTRLPELTTFDT
jgi:hypothetical protein